MLKCVCPFHPELPGFESKTGVEAPFESQIRKKEKKKTDILNCGLFWMKMRQQKSSHMKTGLEQNYKYKLLS